MRYVFGDYSLDTEHYELRHREQRVRLEPRVFNLLATLVQHPGQTLTKEALWAQVWPQLPNAALDGARDTERMHCAG